MTGQAFPTGITNGRAQGFIVGGLGDNVYDDCLPDERMGFATNTTIGDARDPEDDRLDFSGHELFATNVDGLAYATQVTLARFPQP